MEKRALLSKNKLMHRVKVSVKTPYFQYIILGILLSFLPMLQKAGILKSYQITLLGSVIYYSIAALGLNLLLGYSGLASLGTAGFMGLGAFSSIYFTTKLNVPYELSFIIAIIIPLAIGLLVGFISLRIEGMYLAIATLVVAEILTKVFTQFTWFSGGAGGSSLGYPKLLFFGKLDKSQTFTFMSIVLVIMMMLTYNIIRGRTGRALMAMRGSESAAQAMGINILKYRLITFGLSTVFTAIAGILWAGFIARVTPDDWNLNLSLNILAIIVIGGIKSIWGTLLGAFLVFGVPKLILENLPIIGTIPGLSFIFTGILIIVVIMFYPNGLIYIGYDVKKWYRNIIKWLEKKRENNGEEK